MIINIFSAYFEPLLKDINHPALLKEWKLNLDAADYERNIDANLYKPSFKNKFNLHDSDEYCPTSIKDTIKWFPFLAIIEHTANIMTENKGLISSLLKVFSMFELRLIGYEEKNYVVAIMCINCKRETGLFFIKYNI